MFAVKIRLLQIDTVIDIFIYTFRGIFVLERKLEFTVDSILMFMSIVVAYHEASLSLIPTIRDISRIVVRRFTLYEVPL